MIFWVVLNHFRKIIVDEKTDITKTLKLLVLGKAVYLKYFYKLCQLELKKVILN